MQNPLKNIFNRNTPNETHRKIIGLDDIAWNAVTQMPTYNEYKQNSFNNAYPSITAIANRFILVQPYAVNDKGAQIMANNVIQKLYYPNQTMSAVDFREALAIMTLVHDKVYVRVHSSGTPITPNNITGFTFLEHVVENAQSDGSVIYRTSNATSYTSDEVIVLKNINPYNLNSGYSPTTAVFKWAKLDDYIANYENGFFENGAIPAGQLVITARTIDDFRDIKENLKARHKGSGKNNNVTYTFRPTDTTGKPQDAQITWVPFNQGNNTLDLKALFEQANMKIDSVYGVPASIRGVNDSNTYASIRADENIFIEQTVKPLTLKIYTKFTHELNRITGGLGFAIAFELDAPDMVEEDKLKAETQQIEANTVIALKDAGFTLASIVDALELENDFERLVVGAVDAPTTTDDVTDNIEDEEQPVVLDTNSDAPVQGKNVETKVITDGDRSLMEKRIETIVNDFIAKHVALFVATYDWTKTIKQLKKKAVGDVPNEFDDEFTKTLLPEILAIVSVYGVIETATGTQAILRAGLSTEQIKPFQFTRAQKMDYEQYLQGIVKYFDEQTATQIRAVLYDGFEQGLSVAQIQSNVLDISRTDIAKYRAVRLARTEVNLASGNASIISMTNIQTDTGYIVEKVWNSRDDALVCEYCKAMDGTKVDVTKDYIGLGETITGIDGGTMTNDFYPRETAQAHPNCRCWSTYEVSQ